MPRTFTSPSDWERDFARSIVDRLTALEKAWFPLSGDVTGPSYGPQTVVALQTIPIDPSAATPADGDVLQYSASSGEWEPVTLSGGGTPASTVQGPDYCGVAPAVGTSTNYAREDHDHGFPDLPAATGIGKINTFPFVVPLGGSPIALSSGGVTLVLAPTTVTGFQLYRAEAHLEFEETAGSSVDIEVGFLDALIGGTPSLWQPFTIPANCPHFQIHLTDLVQFDSLTTSAHIQPSVFAKQVSGSGTAKLIDPTCGGYQPPQLTVEGMNLAAVC